MREADRAAKGGNAEYGAKVRREARSLSWQHALKPLWHLELF